MNSHGYAENAIGEGIFGRGHIAQRTNTKLFLGVCDFLFVLLQIVYALIVPDLNHDLVVLGGEGDLLLRVPEREGRGEDKVCVCVCVCVCV